MRKIELLVPASSLEVLKIAVIFGADAVYIGGEAFGLRAKAKNFSHEDMKEGIAFAHEHGVKVYVTVNILAHNYDLPGVREYLTELKELKPDALIIADPGIYMYAKEICPEIERHISTQANNTNYETYRFWYNLESANQADWTKLIDYYFQSETGIGALDASVKEASAILGTPRQKRQIVISIPEPIVYQHPEQASSSTKYWGKIDNQTLDFSNSADRIKACKWYIDQVRAKFNEKNYQHVELAGFYWLAEKATDTRDILNAVAIYLNKLKYSFNWIPYYGAESG